MTTAIDRATFIRSAEAEATGETSPLNRALRRVLEEPSSDWNREVYADELDAVGEHQRAEFIRVQVELAVTKHNHKHKLFGWKPCPACKLKKRERELAGHANEGEIPLNLYTWFHRPYPLDRLKTGRGFIVSIECNRLTRFMSACERCRGRGFLGHPAQGQHGFIGTPQCPACRGAGITHGMVDTVFREQPVTEVVLWDKSPLINVRREASWWVGGIGEIHLPQEIFDLLEGEVQYIEGDNTPFKRYPTHDAAMLALSRALVAYGRKRTGLTPLEWPPLSAAG